MKFTELCTIATTSHKPGVRSSQKKLQSMTILFKFKQNLWSFGFKISKQRSTTIVYRYKNNSKSRKT